MIYQPVLILKPEKVAISDEARIDSFVKIEGGQGVTIGRGVHISSFVHLNVGGGRLIIGDYCAVASGARILTGTNTPAGRSMSSAAPDEMQVVYRLEVMMEPFSFVGAGATVLPGVHIYDYAVLGAGAVATKDIEPYAIMVGVPARKIGDRREHPNWQPWGAPVELPILASMTDREKVKAGLLERYQMQVPDQFADDFTALIESMIKL